MTLTTRAIEDGWVRCLYATDAAMDAFLFPPHPTEETR